MFAPRSWDYYENLKKSLFQSLEAIGDKPITHRLLWLGGKLVFLSSVTGRVGPGEVLDSLLGDVSGLITQLGWSALLKHISASLWSFTVQRCPFPFEIPASTFHIFIILFSFLLMFVPASLSHLWPFVTLFASFLLLAFLHRPKSDVCQVWATCMNKLVMNGTSI